MLQSIERQSGLPIAFDPVANAIHWLDGTAAGSTSIRTAVEMRDYIREPDAMPTQGSIYTVYRAVARREDAARISGANLRYDITIIPPGYFSGTRREFFRTAGHYHALLPGGPASGGMTYPEVYEVISGRAYWLLQRPAHPAGGPATGNPAILDAVYIIEAGPGEKAIMPPGFGHISINARPEPLVMANWISNVFTYDYEPFRRFHGGGYWTLEGETAATVEFEPNRNYERLPELIKLRPREIPALGLLRSRPLYGLAQNLEALRFLNDPEPFVELLTIDRCYYEAV